MKMLNIIYKKVCLVLVVGAMILVLCSCRGNKNETPLQLQEGSGQHVARIYVKDYGSFDLRLFDDEAKETTESFINYAEAGFYNGKTIYSVINDYCLLSGDNTTKVNGSDSEAAKAFKNASDKLLPLTGSLCVINDGSGVTAEHFMIVTADSDFLAELKDLLAYKMITQQEYFQTAYGKKIDDDTMNIFNKYGGAPWLIGDCIVFGQIYDGMDVVNKISEAEVSEDASYSPLESIYIDHIEIK